MKASAYEQTGAPEVLNIKSARSNLRPSQVRIEVKAISLEGGDVLNRGYRKTRRTLRCWLHRSGCRDRSWC